MWTPTARRQHSRDHLRYGTDLTDAEWAVIEPLLPPAPEHGRPRAWPVREIMNAIFYVLRGGSSGECRPRFARAASGSPGLCAKQSLRRGGTAKRRSKPGPRNGV